VIPDQLFLRLSVSVKLSPTLELHVSAAYPSSDLPGNGLTFEAEIVHNYACPPGTADVWSCRHDEGLPPTPARTEPAICALAAMLVEPTLKRTKSAGRMWVVLPAWLPRS
jgi:hypothetical protein